MKVKINIELWDNSSIAKLEELGLTEKFLKICYENAFKQFVESICESDDMKRTVSVEVEDNTKE